jgi:hypothetical protein
VDRAVRGGVPRVPAWLVLALVPMLIPAGPLGWAAVAAPAPADGTNRTSPASASSATGGEPSRPPPACFPASPDADAPGVVDPFHAPSDQAKRLNADALGAYRLGKWEEARAGYRAAEAADPAFLAPALNIACSFVRQERLDQALTEVRRLLARAFLPWSDEILTAADLGALKVGTPGKQLRAMLDEARRRWADGLANDLFFVARTRPPLRLDTSTPAATANQAPRTLVLGLRQEVFAWSPRTLRYRQLTAEQGHVLALGVSRDRRRIAVVTAEKLVIVSGAEPALRGVTIREIDLGTLTPESEARATVDVHRLEIIPMAGGGFAYRLEGSPGHGPTVVVKDGHLEPMPTPRNMAPTCTLTGHGVSPTARPMPLSGGCDGNARDGRSPDGTPEVEVTTTRDRKNGPRRAVSGPFGGGLFGLAIP